MALPIKTGRTRTLTCTGTLSAALGTFITSAFGTPAQFTLNFVISPGFPGFFGQLGGGGVAGQMTNHFPLTPTVSGTVGISGCGVGGATGHWGPVASGDPTLTGSWTWAIDVEEISTFMPIGRSSYWVIQDQPKLNATVSGSITFAGATSSFSATITPAMVIPLPASGGHTVSCEAQLYTGLLAAPTTEVQIFPVFMGQTIGTTFTHTYSPGGSPFVDLDLGSGIDLTVYGSGGNFLGGQVNFARQPTKQAIPQGQVNAFEIAYPGTPLTYDYSAPVIFPTVWSSFSLGGTVSFDNYSSSVDEFDIRFGIATSLGSSPQLAQGDGIQCRINPASLATSGETDSSQH